MECENCKYIYITKYNTIISEDKKFIIVRITCDKCLHITEYKIKVSDDYMKNKKLVPLHLLKYNYCGPYTNVIKNIITDIKPYNEIDAQCLLHDLSYHIYKDSYHRNISDINLLEYLNTIKKKSISKYIISLVLDIKKTFV
ncbi:unknown similar to AMEV101 [Choristoneura biennis entomopoxvirus]|uniref:Phospholipase A2-like domain-containing protein n=1 Tax=Choristoneura biennis entomopoxvirus TaxID=10288 RepID=A0A916P1B2_CBEPV|nr:unknown similar to AMEV101 [Choristoneura biennis entomopoxvirus]CCU55724.1 unknown similar to AMEV101 [Choristoneura biennis entomopoxvirus]